MSIIPYKAADNEESGPVYSEYRSKRYPTSLSFFLEHQKFQANYAAAVVTAALVTGYFHLLDNQLSGYGLVLFVFCAYMVVNAVTVIIMDTVMVRIVVTPYGLGYSTLLQVVKDETADRILRILNIKVGNDAIHVTTDDRVITFKRSDWPRFDDLVDDIVAAYENGFRERYRVFR
jgi:type II secretory pathway component GspD/PulD (secretin)